MVSKGNYCIICFITVLLCTAVMNSTSPAVDGDCATSPGLYVQVVGSLVFLIAWPLVVLDTRLLPLGRPASALGGATLMVIFSVVSQNQVYEIEGRHGNLQTLFLLVGMMLLAFYFDREGLLLLLALWIFGSGRAPMRHVLWKVCLLAGFMAAFITNDATSLVLSPLLFIEFKRQGRPHREILPLALGIATSANIGSASTIFGNPQNAFISSAAEIPLIEFFKVEVPAAVLGLALNTGLLYLLFYRVLFRDRSEEDERAEREERRSVYAAGLELQSVAGSMVEERQVRALEQDLTPDPGLSSQMAQEREAMHGIDSLRLTPSRSRFSLHLSPSLSRQSIGRSQSIHSILSSRDHCQVLSLSHSPGPVAVLTEISVPEIRITHSSSGSGEGREGGEGDGEVVEVIQESGVVVVESYPEPIAQATPLGERGWRELLFISWLVFITILTVVLLALPPPPLVGAEFNVGVVPLGAAILTMFVDCLLNGRPAYQALSGGIDWPLILLLTGLFVWLRGLQNTCIPHLVLERLTPHMNLHTAAGVAVFTGFVMLGSNIFSNVPLTILLIDRLPLLPCGADLCEGSLGGLLLAWVATVSGNMSLIGSISNLIVAEKARSTAGYQLTFLRYTQFGFVSGIVVIFSGLPVVYILGRFATTA